MLSVGLRAEEGIRELREFVPLKRLLGSPTSVDALRIEFDGIHVMAVPADVRSGSQSANVGENPAVIYVTSAPLEDSGERVFTAYFFREKRLDVISRREEQGLESDIELPPVVTFGDRLWFDMRSDVGQEWRLER